MKNKLLAQKVQAICLDTLSVILSDEAGFSKLSPTARAELNRANARAREILSAIRRPKPVKEPS